jgi:hypothetical protein
MTTRNGSTGAIIGGNANLGFSPIIRSGVFIPAPNALLPARVGFPYLAFNLGTPPYSPTHSVSPWTGCGLAQTSVALTNDADNDGYKDVTVGCEKLNLSACGVAPPNCPPIKIYSSATGLPVLSGSLQTLKFLKSADLNGDGQLEILGVFPAPLTIFGSNLQIMRYVFSGSLSKGFDLLPGSSGNCWDLIELNGPSVAVRKINTFNPYCQ